MAFNRLAIRVIVLGLVFMAGCLPSGIVGTRIGYSKKHNVIHTPLPHHVPAHPRGLSFRFAMVHDVIHERYPRHGKAFYVERERLARKRLAEIQQLTGTTKTREAFDLMDDIGAGLARTGRVDEAVKLLREKLALQQATLLPEGEPLPESEMYTTYANLGTFLVEAHLEGMLKGEESARLRVVEGRDWIAKAMEANPNAHFGREIWQRRFFDFLLEAQGGLALLKQFDMLSNSLEPMVVSAKVVNPYDFEAQRPYNYEWTMYLYTHLKGRNRLSVTQLEADRDEVRKAVKRVGGEKNRGSSVPFDEPMVGLIGMWRQGMGANPHFALCMGETMLRVGQRFLAWNCYERAKELAPQFWPTVDVQQALMTHCRQRQQAIEATMPPQEVAKLRDEFQRELKFGQQYQREYQDYTAARIKAGISINAPDFYDEFHQQHKPIASKTGSEEWYAYVSDQRQIQNAFRYFWFYGIGGGGLMVFFVALGYRQYKRRKARQAPTTLPSSPNP